MSRTRSVLLIILFALTAIADGVFKFFSLHYLSDTGLIPTPVGLFLHRNYGVAFNLPIPLPLVLVFTGVVLLILSVLFIRSWKATLPEAVWLFCLLAGATGNFVDRIVNGFTTDYLVIGGRSVINLSDVLIVLGVIRFLYYSQSKDSS